MKKLNMVSVVITFLISLVLPNMAIAEECVPFASSQFKNDAIPDIIGEIYSSEILTSFQDPGSFGNVYTKFALKNPNSRDNPLINIAFGYQALKLEYYAMSLASFERAFIYLYQENLCEQDLLHFLIFAGRSEATLMVLRREASAELPRLDPLTASTAGIYETMTAGVIDPNRELFADDTDLLQCIVGNFYSFDSHDLKSLILQCKI